MELKVKSVPPADEDLLACDTCARLPDGNSVWRVYWEADVHGREQLVTVCPACARGEFDD
jgi:hypothetical protein